jgi:hypothetical protein
MLLFARSSVALALLFAVGCAPAGMAPAKGRVVFKGQPVKAAQVAFSPVPKVEGDKEPGKPATGFTNAEGEFVLSTFKPYDGALLGQHRVLVAVDDTNPAKCKRTKRVVLEVKPGGNEFEIEMDP